MVKSKNNLRKIAKTKIEELEKAVGESLSKLKRLDAGGWFRHCSYSS